MGAKEAIAQEIRSYIPRKIGTNIYVNSITEIGGTNKVTTSIGISVPRIIYDDLLQKQFIKFTKFDNIYEIEFEVDKGGKVVTVVNPAVIYDKFIQRQSRLIHNIENIVLDQIYPKLVRVSLIKDNLRMIYVILANIFSKKKMTQYEIDRYPKRDRLKKYLTFLEQYGIICKDSLGDYVEGNIPIELQRALKNKDEIEVLEYTFGYVLKDGRKYLKEELNLNMLDTFVEIATTYYYLSLKLGRLIQINDDTFIDEFKEIYEREINPQKFLGYLTELHSAQVLNRKDDLYIGDSSILKSVSNFFSVDNLSLTN